MFCIKQICRPNGTADLSFDYIIQEVASVSMFRGCSFCFPPGCTRGHCYSTPSGLVESQTNHPLPTSLLPYSPTTLLVFVFPLRTLFLFENQSLHHGLLGLFFRTSRLSDFRTLSLFYHTQPHRIRRIQNLELLSINQKCFEDSLNLSTSRNR